MITKKLKAYLLNEKNGYLLNPDNNGHIIMISGARGIGKTYFWKKEIEENLSKQLQEQKKSYVYISFFGKESIQDIKQEILYKASLGKKYFLNEAEAFSFDAVSIFKDSDGTISEGLKTFVNFSIFNKKQKGKKRLSNGGVICFDDLERKSTKININDLFGTMYKLANELQCKIVMMVNGSLLDTSDSKHFGILTEKIVNKFIFYEKTNKVLFEEIYDKNPRYKKLNLYKENIFKAIDESAELNAQTYIQVLNNCIEWAESNNDNIFRELTLLTIFFLKFNHTLEYEVDENNRKKYLINNIFLRTVHMDIYKIFNIIEESDFDIYDEEDIEIIFQKLYEKSKSRKEKQTKYFNKQHYKLLEKNKEMLMYFIKYVYKLKIDKNIDKDTYNRINFFIKTGIVDKSLS